MVFNFHDPEYEGPCFRCICPYENNALINVEKGSCSHAGVLGPIPGIFGALQANEVLKLAAGNWHACLGQGRMLIYNACDALNPFKSVQLSKNKNCKACGLNAPPIKLDMLPSIMCGLDLRIDDYAIDHETFWSLYMDNIKDGIPEIRLNRDLKPSENSSDLIYKIILVDSRPRGQYAFGHFPGAISWPFECMENDFDSECPDLPAIFHKRLNTSMEMSEAAGIVLLFICRRGNASRRATMLLKSYIKGDDIMARSVAGGYHGIKERMNIKLPVT
ncbi:bifunctional Ubiquitin-activating enzyme/Rhodanese-like domain superfamily/Rhodanese-like domain [Babesia duncani]|uniref:Bifunctional Ubiquitin-activating enzyme/Rhodanese-like domain superfamily/Rhodanese-like domain n=1 Tax=Babesia duncani TaxID=323732 RepID=A0AAD9UQP4_9APIC|nr:bifunctional Ubiquitin-activating enzyme/Rhodanese-like domain superfamily/Rhodanese-like domain [Babesia duncani]